MSAQAKNFFKPVYFFYKTDYLKFNFFSTKIKTFSFICMKLEQFNCKGQNYLSKLRKYCQSKVSPGSGFRRGAIYW